MNNCEEEIEWRNP